MFNSVGETRRKFTPRLCLSNKFCIVLHFILLFLLSPTPQKITPKEIGKISSPTGGLEWDDRVTQMVLEMLSHRTPPSCVSQNILTVAEILCPDFKSVKELPSTRFVCGCRRVLSYFTKLMAAYQLAKVDTHLELHHDSTKRCQISIANLIIRIAIEGGFKNVTMNSAILSTNESAVMLTE